MMKFVQGDIIKIRGFHGKLFLIVSKNAYIKATGMFHVCPMIDAPADTTHIRIEGKKNASGVVACEHVKIIDPERRICNKVDTARYADIMEVSDVLQGIFEYD